MIEPVEPTDEKPRDEALEKFKNDVAKFSGNYSEFLVIVKDREGLLRWKSTDVTWAVGAAKRYLDCAFARDTMEERQGISGDN